MSECFVNVTALLLQVEGFSGTNVATLLQGKTSPVQVLQHYSSTGKGILAM